MAAIAQHDPGLAVHTHFQISTGLSRPDYYDWPAHLEQDMAAVDPRVVVLLVGANDDQPLRTPGGGSPTSARPGGSRSTAAGWER
jgi:hypothetical protein